MFFYGYKVPYTIAKKINGLFMDDDFKLIGIREVIKKCLKEDEIIIKPAIDSGGGRNITFLKMNQADSINRLKTILKDYHKDFVIQRIVVQHEKLREINPTSLNTVRLQSFLYKGEVHILACFLRTGVNGSRVDNISNGGIAVCIEKDGTFKAKAFDKKGNSYDRHPNGYIFKGGFLPSYEKIIKSVKELHPRFAKHGIIGWDVAVDETGEPVFIEFNLIDTCILPEQLINGPILKEFTDEVLDEVYHKKKKHTKKSIRMLVVASGGMALYGITNSIMNYYRSMDKTDFRIDFAVTNQLPVRLKAEIEGKGGKVFELLSRKNNPLLYLWNLIKIMRKGRYDIVHAHGNSATLAIEMTAAKLCRARVRIAHCHNTTCDHMLLHKLLKPALYHNYTHAFACSREAGQWLFGDNAFTVINNAIPLEQYFYNENTRAEIRKKLNFESNKVIGHVGHFSYQKNHDFLLKVFSKLYKQDPSYRLLLIGDGVLKNDIVNQVKAYGLEDAVCFYGETLEVSKLLQAMDIFVFPSHFEGLGMAAIEAQAAGLPCIVSDAVPAEAKMTDRFDFLSLNEPVDAWADRIEQLYQSDRKNYAEQIKEKVIGSNFNIQIEADKLKKLYFKYAGKQVQ
jgi:glycosyltransferase involved in cell wall biosynthesis